MTSTHGSRSATARGGTRSTSGSCASTWHAYTPCGDSASRHSGGTRSGAFHARRCRCPCRHGTPSAAGRAGRCPSRHSHGSGSRSDRECKFLSDGGAPSRRVTARRRRCHTAVGPARGDTPPCRRSRCTSSGAVRARRRRTRRIRGIVRGFGCEHTAGLARRRRSRRLRPPPPPLIATLSEAAPRCIGLSTGAFAFVASWALKTLPG